MIDNWVIFQNFGPKQTAAPKVRGRPLINKSTGMKCGKKRAKGWLRWNRTFFIYTACNNKLALGTGKKMSVSGARDKLATLHKFRHTADLYQHKCRFPTLALQLKLKSICVSNIKMGHEQSKTTSHLQCIDVIKL